MMNSARSGRPAKRDIIVIDDDESTSEQPALKSVKREEKPPVVGNSQQQELDTLKGKYDRVVRLAGKYLERAEKADDILDSKDGIKDTCNFEKKRADDLDMRLTAFTRLEEANRKAQSTVNLELALENVEIKSRNEYLKAEMEEMRKDHQNSSEEMESTKVEIMIEINNLKTEYQKSSEVLESRNEALKTQMTDMKKEHEHITVELESKNEELKTEMNGLRKEFQQKSEDLESRNKELKRQMDKMMIDSRIDELTLKVDQYDTAMQPLQQLLLPRLQQMQQAATVQHPGEAAAAAANVAPSDDVVELRESDPLPNPDLSEKLLDLVRQALKCNQLKEGIEAAEKTLNLGTSELIIFAGDAFHPYIRRDLPLLCESKNVPYAIVKSVDELSRVCREAIPEGLAVCSITRVVGSPLESTIAEIKKEVLKHFNPRD